MNCNNKNQVLSEQQAMLQNLQQLQFAVNDLALFLDTHPNDPVALYRHKQYSTQLKQLKDIYENQYGPLCLYSVERGDSWRYIDGPWPWDTRYDMNRKDW